MKNILNITLLGLIFGTIGTTIGGIIGIKLKKVSNKFLSFILSLAAGLMISIIILDLIPEAKEITNNFNIIFGTILGMLCTIICNVIVDNKMDLKKIANDKKSNKELLKAGIITSFGLAIHNIPEGLAIGAGFESSSKLGYSLAIAICIHDLPEGLSMALPMKKGGMNSKKIMFWVIISGIATGIGALIGKIIGKISKNVIGICLAFAAGAMLYIVSEELIPEAIKLWNKRITLIGFSIGILFGIIAINL